MKLIIEIPEDSYRFILQHGIKDIREIDEVIANGTPLPEGHGRIIDVDTIVHSEDIYNTDEFIEGVICGGNSFVISAPTIVEADKESENETNN